jgi:hypothetical protein
MPLESPTPGSAGGLLVMQYVNLGAGEVHGLRLHLAWFDPVPFGGDHDHAYVSGGPVTPSESFISETYAALAALWRPYYSPQWVLSCTSVGYNSAGTYTRLDPGPDFPSYVGTAGAPPDASWYVDRKLHLLGQKGARRRLWLRKLPSDILPLLPIEVGPSSGGLDARDRAWMAYLSGQSGGGAVMPDGTYSFAVRDLTVEWTQPPNGLLVGAPGAPYMVSG